VHASANQPTSVDFLSKIPNLPHSLCNSALNRHRLNLFIQAAAPSIHAIAAN
jgi:hypothetical protein